MKMGKGSILYSNGEKFEGEFEKNKKAGNGVFFFKDGTNFTGIILILCYS